MRNGEVVTDLVVELGITQVTLYKWRRQALIDAGRQPGLKSYEADPLLAARCSLVAACRRVNDLDAELETVRAASALFEEGTAHPKGGSRLSEG